MVATGELDGLDAGGDSYVVCGFGHEWIMPSANPSRDPRRPEKWHLHHFVTKREPAAFPFDPWASEELPT